MRAVAPERPRCTTTHSREASAAHTASHGFQAAIDTKAAFPSSDRSTPAGRAISDSAGYCWRGGARLMAAHRVPETNHRSTLAQRFCGIRLWSAPAPRRIRGVGGGAKGRSQRAVLDAHVPIAARIGNALVSCPLNIAKLCWPSHLAVFYPFPEPQPRLLGISLLGILGGSTNRSYGWEYVAYNSPGTAMREEGRVTEAVADFQTAAAIRSQAPDIQENLGEALIAARAEPKRLSRTFSKRLS
jgi:hypothetical protein